MASRLSRWLPRVQSIRWRLFLLYWGLAMAGSLAVRYINFNIISGLIHAGVDIDLRACAGTLDRLTRMGLPRDQVTNLMAPLLEAHGGNKLESLQRLLASLGLGEVSPRRVFAGVFRPGPPGEGGWEQRWAVPDDLRVPGGAHAMVDSGPFNLPDDLYRVTIQPGPDGSLLVTGTNIRDVHGSLNGLLLFYILSLVLISAVLAQVIWWLMTVALRPLQRVAELAGRIEGGETHLRIRPEEMVVEIGRLGEAFNSMLDRLEGQLQAHARFTADISHELGNPLGSVMVQMQVASEEETSPEELRATLRSCLEITRRMNHLRQSLLNLSLAQAREGTRNPAIDLEPVVEEAVEAVEREADAKGVAIETQGTAVVLPGNPELLHQLLVNLLGNAIRHTPEGSVVRVRVGPAEVDGKPMVSIGVLDEGRGVPPEDVPGLFERFFRSQSDRLVRPSGHAGTRTGLGLAICKSIAKAHQGTIRYSPGPQGGALFEVLLPANPSGGQAA